MEERYFGENIGKLGFGYMRLLRKNGVFDVEATNEMVDEFMSHGFSYFDTSIIYQGSEDALHESVVKRYPRDRFQITTKMTLMQAKKPEDHQEQLDTSLRRLGLDYLDFYLIHALSGKTMETADALDTWGFMRGIKEKGIARHIGFSFHGTPEELDEALTKHPEMDMVQLQINYLDWDDPDVQSSRCYEIARKHNKPITIMEPTKGGLLAGGDSEAAEFLRTANPEVSVASWAFRYAAGLDGLITALSGMENIEHIRDNAKTLNNFKPLTEEERKQIQKAVELIRATPRIPCTSCRYCVPNCPKELQIPMFINMYNSLLVHRQKNSTGYQYQSMTRHMKPPSECIKCKICEQHCPQHIEIADVLAQFTEAMDEIKGKFII